MRPLLSPLWKHEGFHQVMAVLSRATLYAIFMGAAYRFFLSAIRHRELSVAVVTVIFWMSLYAYNRSWAKMLGLSLTLMVYLGGVVFLIDRYLSSGPQAVDDLAAQRAAALATTRFS